VSPPGLRVGTLAWLTLAFAACHGRPQPSPQYKQAVALYNELYQKSLDDAYGEPQMAMVHELLQQVDPASASAADAKELQAKVESGMKEYAERDARVRAEVQAAVARPTHWDTPSAQELPARAAGQAAGPTLDMTRDDFLAHFGDCFDFRGEYRQGERSGEAYGVRAGDCQARYKPFVASLVVLLDNRVKALVPMSDVKTVYADAGAAPPAPSAAAAAPPAPPVRSETPALPRGPLPPGEARQIHVPGAPVPSNAAGDPSVLPW